MHEIEIQGDIKIGETDLLIIITQMIFKASYEISKGALVSKEEKGAEDQYWGTPTFSCQTREEDQSKDTEKEENQENVLSQKPREESWTTAIYCLEMNSHIVAGKWVFCEYVIMSHLSACSTLSKNGNN